MDENKKQVSASDLLLEQIFFLAQWNRENINNNPEQVRKNIDTQLAVTAYLLTYQDSKELRRRY